MADLEIKAGDTRPYLALTLRYPDGTAVPLDGATVRVVVRKPPAAAVVDSTTVVVTGEGAAEYRWADGAITTPGRYRVEAQVTLSDGSEITCPGDVEWPTVLVTERLG